MCSRYLLERDHLRQVLERLGLSLPSGSQQATRYNIAPGQPITIIRVKPHIGPPQELEMRNAQWGLTSRWTRQGSPAPSKWINARVETIAEKPSFRAPWREGRRCLIPASGFFEWEKLGRARAPILFQRKDRRPFCFAGIWDAGTDVATGEILESCAILTTVPNALIGAVHHRMPAMLDAAGAVHWLSPSTKDPARLIQPYPTDTLTSKRLDGFVNKPSNEGPECLTPAPSGQPVQLQLGPT